MSAMAEHYHVRRRHLSSTGSEDYEDENLDPRIQVELEKLNKASEEINRLELELDDARASFRQTLSESTQKLDVLAKKLGSCVEKARPYYDSRVKAKEAHLETQRAALRFERACSMHEAAKEMVQLAEQGYMRREQPSDPAWQEMLNHATMKVNEAEKERNESELEHQRTMIRFKNAEDQVQALQKELKRAIAKSKPYFEMKAKFNQIMEEHKHKVSVLEEDVSSAKSLYSTALRSLEAISDEIHRQRMERRQQQQLGVRGAGVGAESPLPPPSWDKGHSVEGSDAHYQTMDPLGVIKVPSVVSSSGSRRSRNLSGESNHGKDQGFVESKPETSELPPPCSVSDPSVSAGTSTEAEVSPAVSSTHISTPTTVSAATTVEEGVYIPADPLGVLPPIYTSSGVTLHASSASGISHPAFSGQGWNSGSSTHVTSVTHPMVSHAASVGASSQRRAPAACRSKSESTVPEKFVPPSAVYPNPEKARRESYRQAVERYSGEYALVDEEEEPGLDSVYKKLPHGQPSQGSSEDTHTVLRSVRDAFAAQTSRQRSYSNPVEVSPRNSRHTAEPSSHPIPVRMPSGVQEALADGRKHGSAPERSASLTCHTQQQLQAMEGGSQDGSPTGGSPATRRAHKLQGLILRVDACMDPVYPNHTQGTSRTMPPPAHSKLVTSPPPPAQQQPGKDVQTRPVKQDPANNFQKPQGTAVAALMSPEAKCQANYIPTKPIIRSASNVSAAGSERSETELSEVESVSATQSPTKPRSRLLKVPSSMDVADDSSDTESLASTGPMLDDEQVEFLTMDFSDALDKDRDEDLCGTYPQFLRRDNWSRMSLPSRLSHLEGYLLQAKRLSGDLASPDANGTESPTDEERAEVRDIIEDLKAEEEAASEPGGECTVKGETNSGEEEKGNMIVVHL